MEESKHGRELNRVASNHHSQGNLLKVNLWVFNSSTIWGGVVHLRRARAALYLNVSHGVCLLHTVP